VPQESINYAIETTLSCGRTVTRDYAETAQPLHTSKDIDSGIRIGSETKSLFEIRSIAVYADARTTIHVRYAILALQL
jgi:hypothetical protein